jgi:hypothetical protein
MGKPVMEAAVAGIVGRAVSIESLVPGEDSDARVSGGGRRSGPSPTYRQIDCKTNYSALT